MHGWLESTTKKAVSSALPLCRPGKICLWSVLTRWSRNFASIFQNPVTFWCKEDTVFPFPRSAKCGRTYIWISLYVYSGGPVANWCPSTFQKPSGLSSKLLLPLRIHLVLLGGFLHFWMITCLEWNDSPFLYFPVNTHVFTIAYPLSPDIVPYSSWITKFYLRTDVTWSPKSWIKSPSAVLVSELPVFLWYKTHHTSWLSRNNKNRLKAKNVCSASSSRVENKLDILVELAYLATSGLNSIRKDQKTEM